MTAMITPPMIAAKIVYETWFIPEVSRISVIDGHRHCISISSYRSFGEIILMVKSRDRVLAQLMRAQS